MKNLMACCLIVFAIGAFVTILSVACLIVVSLNAASAPSIEPTPSSQSTQIAPDTSFLEAQLTENLRREESLDSPSVKIEGDTLTIRVRLDRDTLDTFYTDIGTIHGVVVRVHPPVQQVIIHDLTGQKIEMPMGAMIDYYYDRTTWDEFRETWVITPG